MLPPKIQKRSKGETAVYGDHEWIYAPWGLREATWKQIAELRAQGHRIRVIRWPEGDDALPPAPPAPKGKAR